MQQHSSNKDVNLNNDFHQLNQTIRAIDISLFTLVAFKRHGTILASFFAIHRLDRKMLIMRK